MILIFNKTISRSEFLPNTILPKSKYPCLDLDRGQSHVSYISMNEKKLENTTQNAITLGQGFYEH